MIKYLLLFLLLIILPDIYIWWNFTRPQSTYWQTALLLSPTVIMLASIAYCLLVPGASWSFNVFFTLLCVIAVPKLAFLVLSLIGQGIAWPFSQSRQALTIISVVLSVGICLVQLYGTFFGWQRLSTHHRTLHVDRLPKAFDGYRVVQISDLHVGTYGTDDRFLCRLAESVNACHADLVVFTGDIVNTSAKELTPHLEALSRIKAKDDVVSILGNHDYCIYGAQITDAERLAEIKEIVNAERSLGWHVLLNEHTTINRGTDTLFIAGVENTGKPPFPPKEISQKHCKTFRQKLAPCSSATTLGIGATAYSTAQTLRSPFRDILMPCSSSWATSLQPSGSTPNGADSTQRAIANFLYRPASAAPFRIASVLGQALNASR